MADIRKQPSPVDRDDLAVGPDPLRPDRRGDRPAHALVVRPGVKYRRGPWTSIASDAQWVEAVTSTKISSSGPSAQRSWIRKTIGSTPRVDPDLGVLAAVERRGRRAILLPERGAGGAADRRGVGEQAVEEDPRVGAELDAGVDVPAEVVRVGVDVDDVSCRGIE